MEDIKDTNVNSKKHLKSNKYVKREVKKLKDFFYDHPYLRIVLEYLGTFIGAAISAFIYAYSFKSFISPAVEGQPVLVTGGAGGTAQVIVKIFQLCGMENKTIGSTNTYYIIQSISYILINIPLGYLAFKKIGKKFTFFTLINVALSSLFINLIPSSICTFYYGATLEIDRFTRVLFAGILTGFSIALAVQFDHSSGGTDILSIYVTSKKTNVSMGKVSMIINVVIITIYTILTIIGDNGDLSFITMALYSFVYFYTSSTVIDAIVSRNKKEQLQIITSNEKMPDILISYFPHSATIVHGEGAFTKKDKMVVYTVMSSYEVKRAIKIIQEIDPQAFITITKVSSQVGRFYITPRK